MTQEVYALSNLNHLLSTDNITEDDILQFPNPSLEELDVPPVTTPLINDTTNPTITPTNKPTIVVNDRPKKCQLFLCGNIFRNKEETKKLP